MNELEKSYTTNQLAKLMRVTPVTIVAWCNADKIKCIRTLGGHRRISESEVKRILDNQNERKD